MLLIYSWIPFLYSCIFQGYLGAGEFSAPPAARLLDRNQVSALLSLVAEQGRGGDRLYILPRKCAADFRGDRLCLLEICHTANGQPEAGWCTNVEEQKAGIEGRGRGFLPAFDLYPSAADTDPCTNATRENSRHFNIMTSFMTK